MKNIIITISLISALLVFGAGIAWSTSSPGKKTGSPGDGKNCTQCHNGTVSFQSGWISSDIPPTGYVAGQTYTITVNGTHSTSTMFGFECTAEDNSNNKAGTFIITNASETRYPPNMTTAVTHTNAGTTASGGSKSWSFDWTAPNTGTGQVTFYAAVNAANGNMGTGGDNIYTSNLVIDEMGADIISSKKNTEVLVYPNPAKDIIHLNTSTKDIRSIKVYSSSSQLVIEKAPTSSSIQSIDINELEQGLYYLIIESIESKQSTSFLKL